jgi:hypothetical protein
MKKRTFRRAQSISLLMGFIYFGGLIWFSEYYLSETIYFAFLTVSTVLALIILPLISDAMLKKIIVRILGTLLGIIGILNTIYTMFVDLTLPNSSDVPALIMRIVVLLVLVIMIRRIINPQLEDDFSSP